MNSSRNKLVQMPGRGTTDASVPLIGLDLIVEVSRSMDCAVQLFVGGVRHVAVRVIIDYDKCFHWLVC
eukprot:7030319-Pyramimonas_sp.AAC.1